MDIIKLLEDTGDKLSSRETVLSLCADGVSDYQRGVIQGKIEMLTYLLLEIADKNND